MANKRQQLAQLLQARPASATTPISVAEVAQLLAALQPVSGSHFRRLLRESGFPLAPLVEGVRQDSLDQLERTLLALLDESAPEARRLVIEAKDHARMAQRRAPAPEREEKLLWMTVWLENRSLFREWLQLRRAKLQPEE